MTQASAVKAARLTKPFKATVPAARTETLLTEAEPTVDQIRQRAYELYLFRGDGTGSELEDWLEAERELRAKHA